MPLDHPFTPTSRFADRIARRAPARSSSHPSSLRNAVSVRDESEVEVPCQETENHETDTSDSECETAKRSDDETDTDNDDNEWSGQNGNLESVVIAAVEGDLGLAAHLIPLLHRDLSLAVKSKVESWQWAAGHGSDDASPTGSGGKTTSYMETSPDRSPTISRKRRRTGSDGKGRKGVGGWDDDDDDDDDGKGQDPSNGGGGGGGPHQMLACPFHKRDSAKYGIQHGNSGSGKKHKYRACMGPGFKSIQRLK